MRKNPPADRLTIPASVWYADPRRRERHDWNRRTYTLYAPRMGAEPDSPHDPTSRPMCASPGYVHFRDCGDAHDIAPRAIRHTGWYGDEYGDNLCVGHVWQMPARDGTPRYVPGYRWTDADIVTLYPLDVHEDKADAAASADGYAECAAELEREYQAAESARLAVDEARERIREYRAEHRAIVRELRTVPASAARPALCSAIRARLRALRSSVSRARDEIRKAMHDNPGAFRNA